jgi:DNA-binding transcriptional regulator YiaG
MEYGSDILQTIHESATEKFAIGAITESRMREYDEMCLVPDTKMSKDKSAKEAEIKPQADLVTA